MLVHFPEYFRFIPGYQTQTPHPSQPGQPPGPDEPDDEPDTPNDEPEPEKAVA